MGGFGSGRSATYFNRLTTEDYFEIDIRQWHRQGRLMPGNVFIWTCYQGRSSLGTIGVGVVRENLIYIKCSTYADGSYLPIKISWSPCNYGGSRPWFHCPNPKCESRVAILYDHPCPACRHCYRIPYRSQSESSKHRARRRADKIRDKLGWTKLWILHDGPKPKGMHWITFRKYLEKCI